MSKFNPFARRKDPPAASPPNEEEQRRQRQQNARQFFENVRQEPETAPPPANLPAVLGGVGDLLAPPPTPQLPAALDVAQELERARANGLFNGVVRQIRKEAEAEAEVGKQVESKLQTRTDIVERSEELLKAQNSLKSTLYDGQILEENKAAELHRARLARLQAERELLAKASAPYAPPAAPAPPPPQASVAITDTQIEEEAVRLVVRLGGGSDAQLEACRPELDTLYPPLTVEEIVRRARAMRLYRAR